MCTKITVVLKEQYNKNNLNAFHTTAPKHMPAALFFITFLILSASFKINFFLVLDNIMYVHMYIK